MPIRSAQDATLNFDRLQKDQEKTEASIKALEEGAWTAVTLGTKVESAAAYQTVRCRTEAGSVRLRGIPLVKAGEELKVGETLATLPEGFRPPGKVRLQTVVGTGSTDIATTGVITNSYALKAGEGVSFDGFTFNLT